MQVQREKEKYKDRKFITLNSQKKMQDSVDNLYPRLQNKQTNR